MSSIVVESQTEPDKPEPSKKPKRQAQSQEEWAAWVQSIAGSITDPNFERPPQLPLEERDPL